MTQVIENTSVAVKINQSTLLKNLRFAFSDPYALLNELPQNARRAGATAVHIHWDEDTSTLSVTDDGEGITDFQKLLTVADSGWDQEVVEKESPFGMGFMSCMYAADRVSVHSNGRFIEFATSDVLDFEATEVRNSDRSLGVGTIVEMQGGDIAKHMKNFPKIGNLNNASKTSDFVQDLLKGFALPTFFNGVEVVRTCAVDSKREFYDTPVGKIAIDGLHNGKYSEKQTICFLQGIQVANPRYSNDNDLTVVHLDPTKFFGRMPDRTALVDRDAAMLRINSAIEEVWRTHLDSELIALGEADFLEKYVKATMAVYPELFGKMSVLPKTFVSKASDNELLSLNSYDNDPLTFVPRNISRESIESGEVALYLLDVNFRRHGAISFSA